MKNLFTFLLLLLLIACEQAEPSGAKDGEDTRVGTYQNPLMNGNSLCASATLASISDYSPFQVHNFRYQSSFFSYISEK